MFLSIYRRIHTHIYSFEKKNCPPNLNRSYQYHLSLSLSLSLWIYIYIYIYIRVCVCMSPFVFIYISLLISIYCSIYANLSYWTSPDVNCCKYKAEEIKEEISFWKYFYQLIHFSKKYILIRGTHYKIFIVLSNFLLNVFNRKCSNESTYSSFRVFKM